MEIRREHGEFVLSGAAGATPLGALPRPLCALLLEDLALVAHDTADGEALKAVLRGRLAQPETVEDAWRRLAGALPAGHAVCNMEGHSLRAVVSHPTEAAARAHAAKLGPNALRTGPLPFKLWFLGRHSIGLVSEHATRDAAEQARADAPVVLQLSGPHSPAGCA